MIPMLGNNQRVRKRRPPKTTVIGQAKPGQGVLPPTPVGAPQAPTVPAIPGVAAPQQPPDPQDLAPDSQYLADAARRAFEKQQALTGIQTQADVDKTDFQESLRRMLDQRPQVEQQTREGANREGLFYSGQLGKRLGDVATDFTRRQADAQLAYDRREAAREAARRAIEAGAPLADAAALAAAADRQVARDQMAADNNSLAGPDGQTGAAAAPARPNAEQQRAAAARAHQQALARAAQQAARARPRRPRKRPR